MSRQVCKHGRTPDTYCGACDMEDTGPRELAETTGSAAWAVETMEAINRLTPNIEGKAFDPDWFLLRQRLEAMENSHSAMMACLKSIVEHIDSGGTISDSRLDMLRFIEPAKRAINNPPNNQ